MVEEVEIRGKRIMKPFVGNRSSEFHPELRRVRREGSYIYEEFMPTGGTDVKVYTVGPEYAHAEARKSAVVDGVVMRSADGKEVRYPVLLTPIEKQMAREVCMAFGQAVSLLVDQDDQLIDCEGERHCSSDFINSLLIPISCDQLLYPFKTWYYDDAASVLQLMLLKAKAPHLISVLPAPSLPSQSCDLEPQKVKDVMKLAPTTSNGTFGQSEELRWLRSTEFEVEDCENAEKLQHVKTVLEEVKFPDNRWAFFRDLPQSWVKVIKEEGTKEERPTEALMLLKYDGVLTHAGRKQAEELGRSFRNYVYPGEGPGLLRLHSSYRHDLKIYSSDEGRVQEVLCLLWYYCMVGKDSSMLDGLDTASQEMDQAKVRLLPYVLNHYLAIR
ncbi:unnamed protein product [Sphagnum balticum]